MKLNYLAYKFKKNSRIKNKPTKRIIFTIALVLKHKSLLKLL